MSHPQSDSPVSPISVGDSSDSQPSPASADSPGSPAVVGPLGPVGRVTAASYSGASASAVAFPDPARRPFPDPRPAGSAVSASSALHAVLEDSEEGTLMETLGMEVVTRDAHRTEVRMPVDGARQVAAAPDDAVPVGAELTVSHLRSVSQGWVKATATPLHRGRRTVVYQVTVTDDDERTIAVGTLRSLFT